MGRPPGHPWHPASDAMCLRSAPSRLSLFCERRAARRLRPQPTIVTCHPRDPHQRAGTGAQPGGRGGGDSAGPRTPTPSPPLEGASSPRLVGGSGTRPWWLALLACGGAYWPLAFDPSAMTSRHPHCRGHPPSWGWESRMQLLPMALGGG